MSAPVQTRAECWRGAHEVLAQALARLVRAEAEGRLTPDEAAVMERIRARQAAPTQRAA